MRCKAGLHSSTPKVLLSGVFFGLIVSLAAGCGDKSTVGTAKAASAAPPVPVRVTPARSEILSRRVEVVGSLKGWEQVTVGTKQKGRVLRVFKDMGDRIAPGEPLLEMETVDAQLAVEQAEKRLAAELAKLGLSAETLPSDVDFTKVPTVVRAKVALERAELAYNKERSLAQRQAGIYENLQNAENDLRSAQALLNSTILEAKAVWANAQASRVQLDVARQALTDMLVKAPVPSQPPPGLASKTMMYAITERRVAEGQMLRESDPAFALVIEDPLRLWSSVPERYSADIHVNQEVKIAIASYPGEEFKGTVTRINPSVDPASRTFQVEAQVSNPEVKLRPGGFAKASISTRTSDQALIVPLEAIVQYAGVTKLFVVEGAKAGEVQVELGDEVLVRDGKPIAMNSVRRRESTDEMWVEVNAIKGKIAAGAQVVTMGQTKLFDGATVEIKTADTIAKGQAPSPAAAPEAAPASTPVPAPSPAAAVPESLPKATEVAGSNPR